MGLFDGKKALIFGLANDRSIAWGIAQALHREGCELAFSYGAPPHAGWSIGLERLTMMVTGMSNIRECCMFPRDRDRLVP